MCRRMQVLFLLLTAGQLLWALGEDKDPQRLLSASVSARYCSLECVLQGGPGCDYCRINRADVERTLGFHSLEAFGSCIPWPCFVLLGEQDSDVCHHYVHAPHHVTVEFRSDQNLTHDTIVVYWRPSQYGIDFLRGFQVSLQALGGSHIACQLFLFQRNISLSAEHAQTVYQSDPFSGLVLGAQYAVTVMALPVPELWDKFYQGTIFSTRSCAEKSGLEMCKKDWYPQHIKVQQEGPDIVVTFNLAPPHLGISDYFSLCYGGGGLKRYTAIRPNPTKNRTHYSYQLIGLQEGSNYTCEIAADEVDAVRKMFNVTVMHIQQEPALPLTASPSLALVLPLGLALVAIFVILLAVLARKRTRRRMKKLDIKPDIIEQHQAKNTAEEATPLSNRLTPPRLLICYSSDDGPAHVRAVMQLGVFLQQHMATQVCLDLWDSLSLAEEGTMAWHCRRIQESDFVLVVCSRGLQQRAPADPDEGCGPNSSSSSSSAAAAAISLIGEELGRARANGRDLSKYMAAIFEYSEEKDIPAELGLVSRYTLTRDLPLLFSHLHGVSLHRPGGYLRIEHISEGYAKLPAGAALQWSIHQAGLALAYQQQAEEEPGSREINVSERVCEHHV